MIHAYTEAGVNTLKEEAALTRLLKWVGKTARLREGVGSSRLEIGFFANVLDLGAGRGLAITTDGVGTKILVAQMMEKFDTIGIDCVAMNVNDVICVGAEPVAMVDYIALEEPNGDLVEEIGKGLYEGARRAKISIVGGEIAQVPEMLRGQRQGLGFDLVGMCVGIVDLERIITGSEINDGDIIVGLRSTGIHSNGLTLARKIFLSDGRMKVDDFVPELGRTIGEELLEPTRIYVAEVLGMLRSGLAVKAIINITSDGLLNLLRVNCETGFVISSLPEPHSIFALIQERGKIPDEEMFQVFNMGIGFCVVVSPDCLEAVMSIARKHGADPYRIGYASRQIGKRVFVEQKQLLGSGNSFSRGCP